MTTYYSLADGELQISRDDPPFEWQGRLDSMPVVEVHPLADGAEALLLLDAPPGTSAVRNLVKIDATANIVWRGELPTTTQADCFVSLDLAPSGDVSASTWSGYRVVLSRETGRLMDRVFTK